MWRPRIIFTTLILATCLFTSLDAQFPTNVPQCLQPIDLCYILDGSGSVGEEGWQVTKQFVNFLTSSHTVDPQRTRVGVVTFSMFALLEIRLRQHARNLDLFEAVSRLNLPGGETDTASALRVAARQCFNTAEDRPDVPNVAILVTDGNPTQNIQDLPFAADELKTVTRNIIVVTTGRTANNFADVVQIAKGANGPPQAFRDYFMAPSYNAIFQFIQQIARTICPEDVVAPTQFPTPFPTPFPTRFPLPPQNCREAIDLCFVLDSSNSLTEAGWRMTLEFAVDLVSQLLVSSPQSNVGVVTFSQEARYAIQLGFHRNSVDLIQAIRGLPYQNGWTNTAAGLSIAANQCFLSPQDRRNVANAVVFVSDGMPTMDEQLLQETINGLKSIANPIVSIGVGTSISEDVLIRISTGLNGEIPIIDRDYFYAANYFRLPELSQRVLGRLCPLDDIVVIPTCRADVCLVLDNSGSETLFGWQEIQQYASQLVEILSRTREITHFGVIIFSDFANEVLALRQYPPQHVRNVIQGVQFADGYTNLADALRLTANGCFRSFGDRPDAVNIAIVITDGNSTVNIPDVNNAIFEIQNAAQYVISIGSGTPTQIRHDVLRQLARPSERFIINPRGQSLESLVTNIQGDCVNIAPFTPRPTPFPTPIVIVNPPRTPQPPIFPPVIPPIISCQSQLDICFLLDRSGSQTQSGWQVIQNQAIDLLQMFRIFISTPYIGVVTFSDYAEPRLDLGPNDAATIQHAILSTPFQDGYTDVAAALRQARFTCFLGPNDRPEGANIVILISDGNATINLGDVPFATDDVHDVSQRVITIGVGPRIHVEALQRISRNPSDVYITPRRIELQNLVASLGTNTCPRPTLRPPVGCSTALDVCFILDSSGSITRADWQRIVDFTLQFTNDLVARSPMSYVGIVIFSDYPYLAKPLGPSRDPSYVNNLRFVDGYTDTAQALRLTANDCFSSFTERFEYRNVAILISDGVPNRGVADLGGAIGELHSRTEIVVPIGIGRTVSQDTLRMVARGVQQPLYSPNTQSLFNLLPPLTDSVCAF